MAKHRENNCQGTEEWKSKDARVQTHGCAILKVDFKAQDGIRWERKAVCAILLKSLGMYALFKHAVTCYFFYSCVRKFEGKPADPMNDPRFYWDEICSV